MTIEEIINSTPVLTEANLNELKNKNYFSGRKIKIGDRLLFGLLHKAPIIVNSSVELGIEAIFFHEEEINSLYEVELNPKNHFKLKLK